MSGRDATNDGGHGKACLSVILCTRNRAEDLRQTLDSLAHVRVPHDARLEVVVADNGSQDATGEVVRNARDVPFELRYLREDRVGKAHAYNAAFAVARGDVLILTDDDVRMPADWVERLTRPIVDGSADLVVGSVRMAPHLRRSWMTPLHRAWLLDVDLSTSQEPDGFVGANVAFSRRVLERVRGFDPCLGPGAMGFCDDNLFGSQARSAGFRFRGAGDCFVEHHFDPQRLMRGSLLDRARRQGASCAYMAYHWMHRPCPLPLVRALIWRALLTAYRLRYLIRRPAEEGCPERELAYAEKLAYALQYRRESRERARYEPNGLSSLDSPSAAPSMAPGGPALTP